MLILLGILLATLTFAQSEEIRVLSSFSKIHVQEAIDVYIKSGSKEEARVVSGNIDLSKILTEVKNGKLRIHLDGSNHRNVDVEVYVTYKSIHGLGASSAASLKAENAIVAEGSFHVNVSSAGSISATIKAKDVELDVSSSGDLVLDIEADEVEADVSSSGDIELSGVARYQDVSASSSGDYNAYDLKSEEADLNASSGGSIKVHVSNKVDATATSGASIRYQGHPKYVDVSSSSGGSIRKS